VRVIVGFAPGGNADTTARVMAQWLSEQLGMLLQFIHHRLPDLLGFAHLEVERIHVG
jgi:hypothetical protein